MPGLTLKNRYLVVCLLGSIVWTSAGWGQEAPAAAALVERAFNHLRGETSVSRTEMTIQRPDFKRTMILKGWTRGKGDAIFFVEKPAKDAGNGTLKKGRDMWSYNPKINRVIKLPPSMMSQSWMGSDFSNNDLSKTDTILDQYRHEIIGQRTLDGWLVYDVRSIPKEDAPVVWGKQELSIRSDGIMLRQAFFDEDMLLVKTLSARDVKMMGGRLFPAEWIMQRADTQDRFTRLVYLEVAFDTKLKPNVLTIANLKNWRR